MYLFQSDLSHPAYPLGNCGVALVAFNSLYPALSGATALLFFLRVRAIYGGQRLVTWLFGLMWVCVVGTAITVPISTRGAVTVSLIPLSHL
jgi:hypothetical protein